MDRIGCKVTMIISERIVVRSKIRWQQRLPSGLSSDTCAEARRIKGARAEQIVFSDMLPCHFKPLSKLSWCVR